jgi:hypothetical protein
MDTEDLTFKVVRVYGSDDKVIVRASNLLLCRAAYDKAPFMYPTDHLEMRQGARVIEKSKEG